MVNFMVSVSQYLYSSEPRELGASNNGDLKKIITGNKASSATRPSIPPFSRRFSCFERYSTKSSLRGPLLAATNLAAAPGFRSSPNRPAYFRKIEGTGLQTQKNGVPAFPRSGKRCILPVTEKEANAKLKVEKQC